MSAPDDIPGAWPGPAPESPADPDRSWAWRDCGDGAEDEEPGGARTTDRSTATRASRRGAAPA